MQRSAREEQFTRLLEQHRKILFKVAGSYCRDQEESADLTQEIAIQLWNSFDRYDPAQRFSTWMYRVAINVAISYYRGHRTRLERTTPLDDSVLTLAAPEPESDDVRRLRHLIQQLDELNRALVLLYLDGNSHEETAEILGISPSNVATKLGRIKQQLRRQFQPV